MSASSSMTRSSRRRRRARRAKAILRTTSQSGLQSQSAFLGTTSQSRLRLDSSPGRGALGRSGQPYCSLGPDGAQSSGPCSHGQRHCIAAVNLNSGARPFPIAKNFARSARPLPTRQWLPYQGSWHREAMTERLYYMPRFRFASRFPGVPSRERGRSGSSNRSGGSSSAITCSSARCWASWRRRAACSLARNSSKYSAL